MSQSNFKLNGAGGGFGLRVDTEAALAALASNNAGPTQPPKTYPFMSWPDTTTGLMKQRNAADTGWITIGPLGQPGFGLGDQVGDYKLSARSNIPNYLRCTFQEVSRSAYPLLFAEIGVFFGPGNGTTTFNLPGPEGRALVIAGAGAGLTNRSIGNRYGTETHSLTEAQNGPHGHAVYDPGHSHGFSRTEEQTNASQTGFAGGNNDGIFRDRVTTANPAGIGIYNSGSGQAHNNIQPSIVIGHLWIRALP